MPGSTTSSKASKTAGTTIQGRTRNRRGDRATVRPQFEQKRPSGLTGAPHAGQNEAVPRGDVLFTLMGNIISAGSASQLRRRGRLGLDHAGAEDALEVRQRPVLDLVAGMPGAVEGLDRGGRHHTPVIAGAA